MPDLSLDFQKVWTGAADFVNALWPIFVIPLGLILGAALLNFVMRAVRGALSSFG